MSIYKTIEARFGFGVPQQYRKVRAAGLFDPAGLHELVLTDMLWMTLGEMAKFSPLHLTVEGLIPFGRTSRGDLFCWYPPWADKEGVPVAFWPKNVKWVTCYAPNFEGFLYRLLLEEFSATWLVSRFGLERTGRRLRRYAQDVAPFLPGEWSRKIRELSTRPLVERNKGIYGVLERADCDGLIEQALSFPRLNQEIHPATSKNRRLSSDNRGPNGQQVNELSHYVQSSSGDH